ncbi:DUF5610 domain-containing protein [Ectothiorhodospira mobilis]|nr:DUF5610 domain-containing protein [Ectothiorhodospira mobilis]
MALSLLPSSSLHTPLPDLRGGPKGPVPSPGNGPKNGLPLVQDRILNQLAAEIPQMDAAGLKRLNPDDFTPEKVSQRIAGFVETGLASARSRGASEADIQSLREAALRGVEKGFADAREILAGLDLLNGRIAEDVDRTERLTLQALDALPGMPEPPATPTTLQMAERYQQARSLDLALTTRDGDQVRIRFRQQEGSQVQAGAMAQGEASAAWLEVSRHQETGYRFSVEGELDEGERQAIQALVQDVTALAGEFFNGDIQAAFARVDDLRFDGGELAAMRLDMTRTEQYSLASRYEQTRQLETPQAPGQRLGQYLETLAERFDRPELQFLEQARASAGQLLQTLSEQDARFREASMERQMDLQGRMERLLQALSGG